MAAINNEIYVGRQANSVRNLVEIKELTINTLKNTNVYNALFH